MLVTPQSALSTKAFSLIEMIVTSLLVGVIVIGVVPLFTRSITNNIYGAEASQLASFLGSGAERVQQRSASDSAFSTESNNDTGTDDPTVPEDEKVFTSEGVLRSVPTYFDTGVRDTQTKADSNLGDEKWTEDPSAAEGVLLWRQRREVREFLVADVFRGNISLDGGAPALTPLGNPKLFDNPADERTGLADITEIREIVESMRGGLGNEIASTPSGLKQKAVVNIYRAF